MMSDPASKIFRIIGLVFGAVGVIAAAICVWCLVDALQIASGAVRAEGTVTRLEWNQRMFNQPARTAYAIVQFRAGERVVEVRSHTSTSPPAFSVGEKVVVFYPPDQPDQARIESFWEQYLLPLIFGTVATPFLILSAAFLVIPALRGRRRRLARSLGRAVQAKVTEIRLNHTMRVNGRHPWVIVAEYREDELGQPYTFSSDYLWSDPTSAYPVGSYVTVYYLPHKPTVYVVELERLSPG